MVHSTFDNRIWGGFALRGVIALLFGFLALARPGITVATLTLLFGAYAFVDGVFVLVASMKFARWWRMLLVGVLGIVIGVLTFRNPAATALGLLYGIAAWAILTGVLEIAAAFQLRKLVPGEWTLGLAGLLSVAFGVLIAARPAAGLLSVVWLIGTFAVIFGVLQLGLAFRILGVQKRVAAV